MAGLYCLSNADTLIIQTFKHMKNNTEYPLISCLGRLQQEFSTNNQRERIARQKFSENPTEDKKDPYRKKVSELYRIENDSEKVIIHIIEKISASLCIIG